MRCRWLSTMSRSRVSPMRPSSCRHQTDVPGTRRPVEGQEGCVQTAEAAHVTPSSGTWGRLTRGHGGEPFCRKPR